MWYLIFVLTYGTPTDHLTYMDAGGTGKIYTDKAQCNTDGKAWLDAVLHAKEGATGAYAACIKLPGTTS